MCQASMRKAVMQTENRFMSVSYTHLMYLIGARKQDLVYAAVLDAILLLITVLVGFFTYSSKVKALSDALKRPVEEPVSYIHLDVYKRQGTYSSTAMVIRDKCILVDRELQEHTPDIRELIHYLVKGGKGKCRKYCGKKMCIRDSLNIL